MPDVRMTYGNYSFRPVPFITIDKTLQKSPDNTLNGIIFTVGINGQLAVTGTGGIAQIISLQNALRTGVAEEGRLFTLTCDSGVLISGYPRIAQAPQFGEGENRWMFSSPYTLAFEFDGFLAFSGDYSGAPHISDSNENWSFEHVDDSAYFSHALPEGGQDINPYQFRLSHTIGAVGKANYGTGGLVKPAWQQARDYVISRLGSDSTFYVNTGVMNLIPTGFGLFNHIRNIETDIRAGSYNITENWLVLNTGQSQIPYPATEDFTADVVNSLDDGLTTVTLQGTIQGADIRNYGSGTGGLYAISQSRYASASGYWSSIQGRLYGRALLASQSIADRTLNTVPVNKSVGFSPSRGTITYTIGYDDRYSNCVAGAKRESIVVTDNNAADVYAAITVLGRSAGPVLQDLNTVTATSRELSIELLMGPTSGCPTSTGNVRAIMTQSPKSQVDAIVTNFRNELFSQPATQVFTDNDTEVWDYKTGKYTRNVRWTWQNGCDS